MSRAHPDLDSLAFLVGTWKGHGNGRYPTIKPFEYVEEAVFTPGPGKPFIAYRQRTRRAGAAGEPLHSESGYIRPGGPDGPELVIAQVTGIVEVHTGRVDSNRVCFRSSDVRMSPTAVEVSRVERCIRVVGDSMRYRLWMAAVGQPFQVHLEAELTRVQNG
ncbi:MAG: FABP family protein [bacterium]|nr:FABP family protein [bacterium]